MSRLSVEKKVIVKLKEIREIVREQCPADCHISITIHGDHYSVSNDYWNYPGAEIDAWETDGQFYSLNHEGGGNLAESDLED